MCYFLYLASNKKIPDDILKKWQSFGCTEVPENHPARRAFEEPFIYAIESCMCELTLQFFGDDKTTIPQMDWTAPNIEPEMEEDFAFSELAVEKAFPGEYVSEYLEEIRKINQFILELVKLQSFSILSTFPEKLEMAKDLPHFTKTGLDSPHVIFRIPGHVVWHCTWDKSGKAN